MKSSHIASPVLTVDFLLSFLESYPAVLTVFGMDGKIIFVNKKTCDFLKKSKAEIVGKHVQDFLPDPAFVEGPIARLMFKGHLEVKVNVAQNGGNTVAVHLASVLVRNNRGKPMGIVAMMRGADSTVAQTSNTPSAVQRILNQLPDVKVLTVKRLPVN